MTSLIDWKPSADNMTDSHANHSVSGFNISALKEITKLSNGNLVAWKQGPKVHLRMNGLYSFIISSQPRPLSFPDCDYFDMRQAAVLHAIKSTIDNANCLTIESMDDPKLAYNPLITQHGADNGFTAASTLTELFSITYNPSMSMTDYLAKVQDLQGRVCDITAGDPKQKILDKLFAVVLVNSLPWAKYGTVVQQLLASIKTLTMSQVSARVRLEATSMATDKAHFKEVYAAKTSKVKKKKNHSPEDHCQVHPN